jgi:hypothetical protein
LSKMCHATHALSAQITGDIFINKSSSSTIMQ